MPLVAVAAAVVAILAGASPAGPAVADAVLTGVFAAAVTVAAAWAAHHHSGLAPWVGAVAGAVVVNAVLRLPRFGFHGASALVAGVVTVPILVAGYLRMRHALGGPVRRALRVAAIGLGVFAALLAAAVVGAAWRMSDGSARADAALEAVRAGDTDSALAHLDRATSDLSAADRLLGSRWFAPARALPVIGHQLPVVAEVAADGADLAEAARTAVREADEDLLRDGPGRFDLTQVDRARVAAVDVVEAIDRTRARLERPRSPWLPGAVGQRLDRFGTRLDDVGSDARLAVDTLEVVPGLLGGDGPRHYFIAFVTPAELRGSGGFIGNYGELTAVDGRLTLSRSGPIEELIGTAPVGTRTLTGPPDYLARYGRFDPADLLQDVTYSPDFPSNAQVIEELYPQTTLQTIDGVISVDPYALAALLTFTGPIEVSGLDVPLTADNAEDILLLWQYLLFDDDQQARSDVLGEATEITFDRLTAGDLPGPRRVADVLGPATRRGSLVLHSIHEKEQALFEQIGADGALPAPDGHDFLALTTQNAGNNKIDVFLRREITYDVKVDPSTGALSATVRITFHNDAPAEGLPDYVIGNFRGLPAGTNRLLLSVYSPHALAGARLDGRPVRVENETELGYRVYGGFLNIAPGSSMTLELDLLGEVTPGDYRLSLAPQPTVNPDVLTATIAPLQGVGGWRVTSGTGFTVVDGAAEARLELLEDRVLTAGFVR